MKRGTFKMKSYEEMKAKISARKKPLPRKKAKKTPFEYDVIPTKSRVARKKAPRKRVNPAKVSNKGYKPPKWFTAIKATGHGATPAQKKYWKLVSIAVRVEDFEKYGGKCVSCPARLERWQDGQCAHFRAWSVCHGFYKYERSNLALSCPHCNHVNDGPILQKFAAELDRRYGVGHSEAIEIENEKHRGEKMEVWEIVERSEPLYEKYKSML